MPIDHRIPLTDIRPREMRFDADIIGPFIQMQELRNAKLKREAYLKDIEDQKKIKEIITQNSGDLINASKELTKAGFLTQAENVRNYAARVARDEGLNAFRTELNKGQVTRELQEVDNPEYVGDQNKIYTNEQTHSPLKERNEFDELELNEIDVNSGNVKDPVDEYLRTQEPKKTQFVDSTKPYGYSDAVNLYLKTVPFSSEKEATDALELLRIRSGYGGRGATEGERKDSLLEDAANAFSLIPGSSEALRTATSLYSNGDPVAARSLLVDKITNSSLTPIQKKYLIDDVARTFPVLRESAEQQAEREKKKYEATRELKSEDDVVEGLRNSIESERKLVLSRNNKVNDSYAKIVATLGDGTQDIDRLRFESVIPSIRRIFSDEATMGSENAQTQAAIAGSWFEKVFANVEKQLLGKVDKKIIKNALDMVSSIRNTVNEEDQKRLNYLDDQLNRSIKSRNLSDIKGAYETTSKESLSERFDRPYTQELPTPKKEVTPPPKRTDTPPKKKKTVSLEGL